ncbi:MAG: YbaN family protein [Candidatus Azobacteroides sp.]|nr:YbaN family protein [Candidatus Azobacteroides sp.]
MVQRIRKTFFSIKRYLIAGAGTLSLVLGIIGIFLPLLPTTPFLLLTAYCYLKSSPRLYHWLINQPRLGAYILNYQKYKVIPVKAKISAISLLWTSILFCIIFVVDMLWLRILLFAIATGVTIHILSYKSYREEK